MGMKIWSKKRQWCTSFNHFKWSLFKVKKKKDLVKPKGKVPSGSRDGRSPEKKKWKLKLRQKLYIYIYVYIYLYGPEK